MKVQIAVVVLQDIEVPDGYIRFTDALVKYDLRSSTLSMWTKRKVHGQIKVRRIRFRRKLVFVSEQDIKRALGIDGGIHQSN